MARLKKPSPALCSAHYNAQQVPGEVIIFAHGAHNTSGYSVFFQQSPIAIFPPQFILWHIAPGGIVLPVITPFTVHTSFKAAKPVATVVVHDAEGAHTIDVEQVLDRKAKGGHQHFAKRRVAKDGPFPMHAKRQAGKRPVKKSKA
jgi:hypothetical protein